MAGTMPSFSWQLQSWGAIILLTAAICIPHATGFTGRTLQYDGEGEVLGRHNVQILMKFKMAVTRDPKKVMVGWKADAPHPCGWRGVACDPRSKAPEVIALEMPDGNLEGVIPPVLSLLTSLQRLDLAQNRFWGSIPPEIANLTRLRTMSLSSNNLTGEIPAELGRLSSLETLLLDDNKFSGAIPDTIGNLSALMFLDLAANSLVGNIPAAISNCHKLVSLNLEYNGFTGKIPPVLNRLTELEFLDLHDNHLIGEIPSELGDLRQLRAMNLAHNNLSGLLPASMGGLSSLRFLSLGENPFEIQAVPTWLSSLTNLVELHFYLMNLEGDIMALLVNLPQLEVIDCWANLLTGSIPPAIGNLKNLTHLDLTANKLSGGIPDDIGLLQSLRGLHLYATGIGGRFPPSLGNCSSLSEMVVELAGITGRIPPEFGQLKNLRRLCVPYNKLEGSVPNTLANCSNLVHIRVQSNFLSGKLTMDFSKLTALSRVDFSDNALEGFLPITLESCPLYLLNLSGNHFQGSIPAVYGNLSSLQMLNLDGNRLTGSIPVELMNCRMLGDIRIASNLLSGTIPSTIGQLGSTLVHLHLYDNILTGELPSSLSQCINLMDLNVANNKLTGPITGIGIDKFSESLTQLVLANNQFSGIIPPEIGELHKLQLLDLSKNKFTGSIPSGIGRVRALQTLDLSNNNLQGEIPGSLGLLQDLVLLDFSSNNLSGAIPDTGILKTFPSSSFAANPHLCGTVLRVRCAGEEENCKGLHCRRVWVPIAATAPPLIIFAIGAFVWWLVLCRDGRQKHEEAPMIKMQFTKHVPRKFSVFDLQQITDNFHSANILGHGARSTVYKGHLPRSIAGDGDPGEIALKVLTLGHAHDAKASAEITGEVTTLLKLKHRNIVKILGYCFHDKTIALILELMPNGSLHDKLHKNPGDNLSWEIRLNIALDVANGLVYLHNECPDGTHFIHRDLKPSNILLDSEFRARISDFGISKLMGPLQEELSVSSLSGTRGYIPPEYAASPKVSTKGDVYSYGVVLLELLTGKQPLNKLFIEEGGIVSWVNHQDLNPKELLDPNLVQGSTTKSIVEMEMLLQLAKMCTQDSPKSRPTSREVMDIIHDIKRAGRSPMSKSER